MSVGLPDGKRFATGVACAVIGSVFWGLSGTCADILMTDYGVGALALSCVRFLAGGALFLAVLLTRRRKSLIELFRDRASLARCAIYGVCGFLLTSVCYLMTIAATNAGTATVIQTSNAVVVMIVTCLAARRLPRPAHVVGLVCAVAAVWLVATKGDPAHLAIGQAGAVWGALLVGACLVYNMYPRRLMEQWGSLAVTGVSMLAGGIGALAVLGASSAAGVPVSFPALDVRGAAVLAAIVVCGTFGAFGLYLHGVRTIGAVRASMIGALEPVSACVFSAVLLGEAFVAADWAGLVLMVAMVVLVAQPGASAGMTRRSART